MALESNDEIPPLTDQQLAGIVVILPTLNEEDSLPLVLNDLPTVGRVIVVDNGCTDASPELARENGAEVVSEPQRGYGAACLRGIAAASEYPSESPPEIVVFVDADYSDHVHELPKLVAPIFADEYDFVLGSRMLGEREPGAMPPQSLWGNRLACFLMRLLLGARYTDLGPFRAIRYSSLIDLGMIDENFGWTVEMQIKAHRAGLRTQEVPTPYRRRIGASKISGTLTGTFRAGYKILFTIARYGIFNRGGAR